MPQTSFPTSISTTATHDEMNGDASSPVCHTNDEIDHHFPPQVAGLPTNNIMNGRTSISASVASANNLHEHPPPPSSKPKPSELIKQMLKDEWDIESPRDFQITAIENIVFDKKDMFIIQGTSRGKSIVPLGALTMLRGVVLTLVPLLGLGTDQVAKAANLPSRVER